MKVPKLRTKSTPPSQLSSLNHNFFISHLHTPTKRVSVRNMTEACNSGYICGFISQQRREDVEIFFQLPAMLVRGEIRPVASNLDSITTSRQMRELVVEHVECSMLQVINPIPSHGGWEIYFGNTNWIANVEEL